MTEMNAPSTLHYDGIVGEVPSTPSGLIYTLVPRVMSDIGGVAKTRRNEQQKYLFRGIEDLYLAAQPALVAHGVFCAPTVLQRTEYRFEKTNEYGKTTTWIHVTMQVEHRFFAQDGSSVSVVTWGEGLDNSDKASNKAMSGAMKYALIELFCVPTQDVEDSDRTTPETGKAKTATAAATITEDIPLGVHPKPAAPVQDGTSNAERRTPDKAGAGVEFIEQGQAVNFARTFKDALSPELRKHASEIEHQWLKHQGITGADGNGTAKAIRKEHFLAVREAALQYAGSLEAWG